MAFDIDMIKKVYSTIAERVDKARDMVGKPLTLFPLDPSEYLDLACHRRKEILCRRFPHRTE